MSATPEVRITVLISGNGTNLQALIDAQATSLKNGRIVRVISNRKAAYGLTRASEAGIPTAYLNLLSYKKRHPEPEVAEAREEYDADLANLIMRDHPNLVVCAGFMHILSPSFLEPLDVARVDVINLHPALRGQFNGANAIERAHKAFMDGQITETGVMIHYVIIEVDMGEPLIQVPISLKHPDDDNLDSLEERIHAVEHKAIVEGTEMAIQRITKRLS